MDSGKEWRYPAIALAAALLAGVAIVMFSQFASRERHAAESATPEVPTLLIRTIDHVLGDRDAAVKIFVFTDPECPFCKRFFTEDLSLLQQRYGDSIVFVYRHFLLPRFSRSPAEAKAIECAAHIGGESAFWGYVNSIYAITPSDDRLDPAELPLIASHLGLDAEAFSDCRAANDSPNALYMDTADGAVAGIFMTPSFLVTDGERSLLIEGNYPAQINTAIEYLQAASRPE